MRSRSDPAELSLLSRVNAPGDLASLSALLVPIRERCRLGAIRCTPQSVPV